MAIAIAAGAPAASPREEFFKLIDRPRVPLAAEETGMPRSDARQQFHFSFAAETGQRVTGLLVKPKGDAVGKLPVAFALHGTGGNKNWPGRGFLAIAIDGRYHGERARGARGSAAYVDAMLKAYRGSGKHPFLYDTVWDIQRLIDDATENDAASLSRLDCSAGQQAQISGNRLSDAHRSGDILITSCTSRHWRQLFVFGIGFEWYFEIPAGLSKGSGGDRS